jgi:hypothetical protein
MMKVTAEETMFKGSCLVYVIGFLSVLGDNDRAEPFLFTVSATTETKNVGLDFLEI